MSVNSRRVVRPVFTTVHGGGGRADSDLWSTKDSRQEVRFLSVRVNLEDKELGRGRFVRKKVAIPVVLEAIQDRGRQGSLDPTSSGTTLAPTPELTLPTDLSPQGSLYPTPLPTTTPPVTPSSVLSVRPTPPYARWVLLVSTFVLLLPTGSGHSRSDLPSGPCPLRVSGRTPRFLEPTHGGHHHPQDPDSQDPTLSGVSRLSPSVTWVSYSLPSTSLFQGPPVRGLVRTPL